MTVIQLLRQKYTHKDEFYFLPRTLDDERRCIHLLGLSYTCRRVHLTDDMVSDWIIPNAWDHGWGVEVRDV